MGKTKKLLDDASAHLRSACCIVFGLPLAFIIMAVAVYEASRESACEEETPPRPHWPKSVFDGLE
jgi:hypothetical protein